MDVIRSRTLNVMGLRTRVLEEGDAAMKKAQAWTTYGFKVAQTLSTAYGKHYCIGGVMGDKVTALYYGISAAQIIDEVAVSYDPDNSQQIEVSMVNA